MPPLADLLALAAPQGVATLVASAGAAKLRTLGFPIPELPQEAVLQRRRNAALLHIRDKLAGLLQAAEIPHVFLKGAAIADRYYPEPVLRDLRDVDVLVPPDKLKLTVRLLVAHGFRVPPEVLARYRRRHFHIPLRAPQGAIVELHWRLAAKDALFSLSASEVLQRATSIPTPHGRLRIPSAEDLVLQITLQCAAEGFSRVARIVDLDRMLALADNLNWERIELGAQQASLGSTLWLALRLARRMFDTPLPPGAPEGLAPRRVTRFHLELLRPRRELFGPNDRNAHARRRLVTLWLVPGWSRRFAYLLQRVGPTRGRRRSDRLPVMGALVSALRVLFLQSLCYLRGLRGPDERVLPL